MAKPWLGKVGALFHYMHSLPMDMKRGCIGILIHPLSKNKLSEHTVGILYKKSYKSCAFAYAIRQLQINR